MVTDCGITGGGGGGAIPVGTPTGTTGGGGIPALKTGGFTGGANVLKDLVDSIKKAAGPMQTFNNQPQITVVAQSKTGKFSANDLAEVESVLAKSIRQGGSPILRALNDKGFQPSAARG